LVEERQHADLVDPLKEIEGDGVVINDVQTRNAVGTAVDPLLHAGNGVVEEAAHQGRGESRNADHVEGEVDIGGGEWLTVVPGQTRAQVKGDRLAILR